VASGPLDLTELHNVDDDERPASPVTPPPGTIPITPDSPEQEQFQPKIDRDTGGATGGGTGGATGDGTGRVADGTIGMDVLHGRLLTLINQQHPPSGSAKIKDPKLFIGEQNKLRLFITHCNLKFQTENTKFNTDGQKAAFTAALLEGVSWNWV
jgi:hypothetical protein